MDVKTADISRMEKIATIPGDPAYDVYDSKDGLYIVASGKDPVPLAEDMLSVCREYYEDQKNVLYRTIKLVREELENLNKDLISFEKNLDDNAQQLKLIESLAKLLAVKTEIKHIQNKAKNENNHKQAKAPNNKCNTCDKNCCDCHKNTQNTTKTDPAFAVFLQMLDDDKQYKFAENLGETDSSFAELFNMAFGKVLEEARESVERFK